MGNGAELQLHLAAGHSPKFAGKYAHRLITGGIGHNLPQEAPDAFVRAVVDVDAFAS